MVIEISVVSWFSLKRKKKNINIYIKFILTFLFFFFIKIISNKNFIISKINKQKENKQWI
jgi:hypothetical protein